MIWPTETLLNWNSLQHKHNPHHVLHQFSYFFLPHLITSHHKYWIYQTIFKAKPIKFISKLYTDYNTLWIKQATHQKADSLTTLSSIQSNTKYAKFSDRHSSIFTTLLVHTTNTTISTKNPFVCFSQFSPHYFTLTCSKIHLYNPHQISLPLYLSNFLSLSFCLQPFQPSMPKIFSQFKLRQGPSELGSLVGSLLRTYTVVISPFYLKVWVVITGLTITDSQWVRPRKLIYCSCGKPSNQTSLICSTCCHYFHTLLIPP